MANTTDVREWMRAEGIEVADKGKIRREFHDRYEAAQRAAGPDLEADLPGEYDLGVTEADFITADEPDSEPEPDTPAGPPAKLPPAEAESNAEERRPRRVATARRTRKTFSERIWGGGGTKPARPKTAHKRMSLRGLAEDIFLDAAWTFQGLPPVEKMLYLQAPMAGVIVDDTIKGTRFDPIAQAAARADQKWKAIESLTAVGWVVAIMMRGRRDETGQYSPETKLMFGGLRHALLSMTRAVPDFSFEEQKQKADDLRNASGQIDAMIAYLFEMPELTEEQLQEMAAEQAARAAANGA